MCLATPSYSSESKAVRGLVAVFESEYTKKNIIIFICVQRVSRHESDLVAKLYYAKRKLVWEFLEGPLKKKIEIQWSDIGAMRATIEDGQPGVWEIEVIHLFIY